MDPEDGHHAEEVDKEFIIDQSHQHNSSQCACDPSVVEPCENCAAETMSEEDGTTGEGEETPTNGRGKRQTAHDSSPEGASPPQQGESK